MTPPFALFQWDEFGNGFAAGHWPQALVLDPNDDPAVASVYGDLISSDGRVDRWTTAGGAWQQVGGSVAPHLPNFGHALAITPGPVPGAIPLWLAYRWYPAGTQLTVGLTEWDGTNWADDGGPGLQHSWDPALTIWKKAKVVAFAEQVASNRSQVRVFQWDGLHWSKVGQPPVPKGSTASPSLAVAANGNLLLACERAGTVVVTSWDGTRWTQLGAPYPKARRPRLAAGHAGHVVIGFIDTSGASPATRCARWDGTSWQPLAAVANRAVAFSVAVDLGGTPVVAWENPMFSQQRIEVSWVGTHTIATFSPPNPVGVTASSSEPLVALDSTDLPVVCWTEGDPSVFEGPDPSRLLRAAHLVPAPPGPMI
jgi:hypothetical protein